MYTHIYTVLNKNDPFHLVLTDWLSWPFCTLKLILPSEIAPVARMPTRALAQQIIKIRREMNKTRITLEVPAFSPNYSKMTGKTPCGVQLFLISYSFCRVNVDH